jgi:hypothetical protein
MPDFKKTQNNFSSGEISGDFFSRNIPSAASRLENMRVLPTGVLARRNGTIRIGAISNPDSIIIPFGNDYLLVMSKTSLHIYANNALRQAFAFDWNIENINQVQYVQRFDTMIFVHPSTPPRVLRKSGNAFSFSVFQFDKDPQGFPIMPFMRFADMENIALSVASHGNGTNWAKITASAAVWTPDNVGGFLMLAGRKWQVHSFVSATELVIATTSSFSPPGAAVGDWKEAAFSDRRGWPRSITFHQDRLVFGGSRDWPCGLWLSKTGRHNNFDVGTGLDDEAIFTTLLSETEQKICTCISSRDLLIMTDAGEWAISSAPLTPSTINVRQHTSIGTLSERFVQPQKINGGTVFISKNEVRELALDELGENYSANDLTLTAKHIVDAPVAMAYSPELCQLFVVMRNGTMAALTKQPSTEVSAWCVYKTRGEYVSVAVQNNAVYAIVRRDGGAYLEMFSEDAQNDSGEYDFSWTAESMPMTIGNHGPRKIRITRATVRVSETRHIRIMKRDFYLQGAFSGDVSASVLGTMDDPAAPLWTISSSEQSPAKILSVAIDGQYEM